MLLKISIYLESNSRILVGTDVALISEEDTQKLFWLVRVLGKGGFTLKVRWWMTTEDQPVSAEKTTCIQISED